MRTHPILSTALALVAVAACDRSPTREAAASVPPAASVSSTTASELALARQASAKYHDLSAALADGYVDIHVVMQNMGRHFMKPSLVDGTFRPDEPEILVYAPEGGQWHLVAVEYAVPLDMSAQAPAGFTGSADVWDHNTGFGLWLLHAWVWKPNPSGMFSPFNPRVVLPGV